MRDGIHQGIPEDTYHADPRFSQSAATVLLDSPAIYRWQLDHPEPPRDVFDVGSAVHAKVLGVGQPIVAIPDDYFGKNGAWTNKARDFCDGVRAEDGIPLRAEVVAQVDAMAESVLRHEGARAILEAEGDVEVTLAWTLPGTDHGDGEEIGVECRGRVDKVAASDQGIYLADLKTTQDASPRGFALSAAKYGYRLQGGAYTDAWDHTTGDAPAGFLFIAVEKTAPYLVGLYQLTEWDTTAGRDRWLEAVDLYATCRARDEWPGYSAAIEPLDLPAWAI